MEKTGQKTLLCIGDSVAAGFGLHERLDMDLSKATAQIILENNMTFFGQNHPDIDREIGAYPRLLAGLLGCGYVNMTSVGLRVVEVLAMLEGKGYPADGIVKAGEMERLSERLREEVGRASVILVSMGFNDVTMVPMVQAMVRTGESGKGFLKAFLEAKNQGKDALYKAYPAMLKRIREMNPSARVAVTGLFNPLKNVSLTPFRERGLGLLSRPLGRMNRVFSAAAAENGVEFIPTESFAGLFPPARLKLKGGGNPLLTLPTHPDEAGHRYIAEYLIEHAEG